MNRFYYLRDFHDMRCKYELVFSVIYQQLKREPEEDEVFIVMSKDRRKVRLFAYDHRSFSLYEKRFFSGYKFMQICDRVNRWYIAPNGKTWLHCYRIL
ncbi:IS66 family insertion sequence element accessory protein TnpB [uncultured Bacteroides sp.]|uniref:IS66 family insertion sequence element accessory protein TnpB n=1 Tax=uncultured Bacteroides sp. TaxID=162156 RepID=UPI00260AA851|nr:IS66 family insertion sequence element accessory protein TnpB [uncultured Bacteroides sp.]